MKRDKGTGFVAVFVALLLAVTMIPATGVQSALADEPVARPATESGDVALEGASGGNGATAGGAAAAEGDAASGVVTATVREDGSLVAGGLVYSVVDGGVVLVGFEDGNALDSNVVVPERLSDGTTEYAVTGVDVAEGQAAPGVKALTLPQTVEDVDVKSLAAALPGLASINVDGTAGAYSSANGLLFRQADEAASSDGSTVRVANRELVWTPPATVIARIPGTCKRVAAGAFTDAKALETIMAFSTVESIARSERDADGNVVKEGAFTDEQVSRVNIVIPISATVQPEGADRISTDVFLSEQVGLDVKQTPWCDYGFAIERFTVGIPHGSTSVTVAVPEDGKVGTPEITIGNYIDYPQWNPKPGEVDWPEDGLVFEYKADMTVSVRWDGSKEAIPARLELPAYVVENGVKTAVTEIAPSAFEGASQLESVVIPEGVTTIGESAFAGCTGLKSVSLPSTLKTIDYAAFKGTGLESIDIPAGVRWIGGEAFSECANLDASSLRKDDLEDYFGSENETRDGGISGYSSGRGTTYGFDTHPTDATRVDYPGYTFLASDPYYSRDLGMHPTDNRVAALTLDDVTWNREAINEEKIWWGYNTGYMDGMYLHTKPGNAPILAFLIDDDQYHSGSRHTSGIRFNKLENSEDGRLFYAYGQVQLDTRWLNRSLRVAEPPAVGDYRVVNPNQSNKIYLDPPAVTREGWGSYVSFFEATLNTYSLAYDSVTGTASELRVGSYTVEDPDSKLSAPSRPGYKFLGWTGPGYTEITPNDSVDLKTAVAAADAEGTTTLSFEGHWEPVSTASFVTGTGAALENVSYYKGDAPALPNPQRTGFWFAGWCPSEGDGDYWADKTGGTTLYNDNLPADAQGDVTLTAVWTPKTYTVCYDTNASKAGPAHDGNLVVSPPANKTFAHPSAANAINPYTASLQFGIGADGSAVSGLNYKNNQYFDLAGVSAAMCSDYSLGEPAEKLGAYPFMGWTKITDLSIGTVPETSRYWTELREKDETGSFTTTHYFFEVFGEGWSEFTKEQCATPYKVYGVWGPTDEKTIALNATQPTYKDNLGGQVVTAASAATGDKLGDATRGTESIRFREHHGFVGQAAVSDDSAAEVMHTGTPERRTAGEIDAAMNLKAPVRYGFQFLGWGPQSATADASLTDDGPVAATAKEGTGTVLSTTDVADVDKKLYIKYDEAQAGKGGKTGFSITDAGAALINADGTYSKTSDTWSAYWAVRSVDVTLRVPSHAVKDVDMTGESTKTGHAKGDAKQPYNTKADYTFKWTDVDEDGKEVEHTWEYAWREGDAGETGNGATSGWYITDKSWNYFDVLEYPAFGTQKDRYSYDGWYEMVKPSATDSTDKALADLKKAGSPAMLTPIATYENLKQPNTKVRVTGLSEDEGGLTMDENYFLTGVGKGDAGKASRTLWLWTSPIRINVASPMGVYLCTTNSYGQAVKPYVVGNDSRRQLEAQAEFQVATGSHDLQLVSVTAEDVTSYDYQYAKDEAGNPTEEAVKDGAGVSVVDSGTIEANPDADGFCDRILTPTTSTGGEADKNIKYDGDSSRMFWVSPVPTATADQVGVVYGQYPSDGNAGNTAAAEAGKVSDASSKLVGDEASLVPDVEKRRYFGFVGGANNTVADDLASSTSGEPKDGYDLSDFVLRRYDNYKAGQKDGLALVGHDDESGASTYRFYYGLDMRRCSFNLTGLQEVMKEHGNEYNSTFDQPLLRVKFTFAAARNDGISYFSMRDAGETAAETSVEDTVITVGNPNA